MGINFIIRHADPASTNERSARYLDELNLNAADVLAWSRSGRDMTTPTGKKIQAGLTRLLKALSLDLIQQSVLFGHLTHGMPLFD